MKYLLLILVSAIVALGDVKLNVVFKWNYANFTWESREQMQAAVDSGNYSPLRSLMYDATKADDGRVFITLPKEFGPGTPATLATVSNIEGPGGLLLSPYPDWSWHNSNCTCNRFTNIHRVDIKCNHLFVLDNGKIGLNQICNPKLLIFRLTDNTLVKTIYIPIDIATNLIGSGLLNTPLIYVPGGCSQILNEMIIFIADMQGYGLIVYDSSTKRMCRVESDYMRPTDGFVSIANDNFTYINGIFSMTTLYDDLFYAPVSGKEIYKINIKTLLTCPDKEQANAENKFMIKLSSQSGQITSAGHAILYSDSQAISLLGTNVYEKSDKNTVILAQDINLLQAVASLKVSHFWKKVTCLSDRFQRFASGNVQLNETNFRYIEIDLEEVLRETHQTLPTIYRKNANDQNDKTIVDHEEDKTIVDHEEDKIIVDHIEDKKNVDTPLLSTFLTYFNPFNIHSYNSNVKH